MQGNDFEQRRAAAARPKLAFAFRLSHAEGVFSESHIEALGELCDIIDPTPLEQFDDARAAAVLAGTEILVTGWGCPTLDAAALARAPQLRLVAHAAGSVKGFVTPEVFAAGVAVCNAADANAVPVAEFTLAAILFANKHVLRYRELYKREREPVAREELARRDVGNWRKTVGIVGFSRIGRRVVELLRPHDLEVLVYDPTFVSGDAKTHGVECVPLDALMARADVVSLHAPSLESTRHMIDAGRLALMRDGATLINTARGALVDQPALERELVSGRISAVIDVTTPETLAPDSPLYELPNVLLTPHIAGALGNERERLGALVVAEVGRFVRGIPLAHAITADTLHLQA